MVWITGVVILLLMIITAFIGYVLPWGLHLGPKCNLFATNLLCSSPASAEKHLFGYYDIDSVYIMLIGGKSFVSRVPAELLKVIADAYKKDPDLISVLIGTLLGDSSIEKRGNSARMELKQGIVHKDWLLWLHSFIASRGLCNTTQPAPAQTTAKTTGAKYGYLLFRLYSNPLTLALHALFYLFNGLKYIKVLDIGIVPYLSPLAIAVWVADDGTNRNGSTAICTDSFSPECLDILINALQQMYGITLNKYTHAGKYTRLAVSRKDMPKFAALIKPHLHPSMLHKLGDFK